MISRPLLIAFLILTLGLAGCSSLSVETKKIDYKSAGKLPPLEVPPDLTSPNRDERYVVPDIAPRGSATFSAYDSERSGTRDTASQEILPDVGQMRVERAGNQRWLVVSESPEKLWPVLRDFWQELGFIVNVELPDAGIMETDWAENRANLPQDLLRATLGKFLDQIYSTPERDKFRTRLERGQDGRTEIYISHRGMYEAYADEGSGRTVWQPRPADPELEAEMLRRLMVRLGTEENRAKTLMAQGGSGEERARMLRAKEGVGSLQLSESFDRAWRRVGLALDRVGFTVEDRDRTQGLYFVRYVDPGVDAEKKSEGGFFSKLKFWKSSTPEANQKFRIHVQEGGDESIVRVLTSEGGVDNSETAKKILGLLYEQLK